MKIKYYYRSLFRKKDDYPYIKGDLDYYRNGKLHRDNGPATIWDGGHKEWFRNGKLHRIDGPAIESSNNYKRWFLYGTEYPDESAYLLRKKKGKKSK